MNKRLKKLKKIIKKLFSKVPRRKFYYGMYLKTRRVNKKLVLIESFHGQTVSDSGLVLAKELLKNYPNQFKIYYASDNLSAHKLFIKDIGLDVTLVDINSFKYTRILATAKYLFSNASLPIYFVKRPNQVYLQTWHGTPLKTLGKKMRYGIESMYNVQHNFLQADYITQPNEFTKDVIMNDYNLEPLYTGKVVMAGYPRNKIFMEPQKASELRTSLGLDGKTVYAYMPTWRGTSNHDIEISTYSDQVNEIFSQLDKELKDDQIFFVNFHPILKGAIVLDNYKHIKPFPTSVDSYSFLNCVDGLITDYSSVFFDFSLTKKPIMLFMYDYEEYLNDRGLIFDVKTLPFRQVFDTDTFCKSLSSGDFLNDRYDDTEYFKTFFKYDSVDISKKLLKLAIENDESDLEIVDYSKNKEKRINVYLPQNLKNDAEFGTLADVAGEDDIVLFMKKWFTKKVSANLHDNYNYAFNYVITTYTPPRTYIENFLAFLGLPSAIRKIHLRDIQRCFPNLNINEEFITEYSSYNLGKKVSPFIAKQINCTPSIDDETISLKCDIPEGYKPTHFVIYNKKNVIIRKTECTPDEANGNITINVKDGIENLEFFHTNTYTPALLATNADGETEMLLPVDENKNVEINKHLNKRNHIHNYYKPIIVSCNLPETYYGLNPENDEYELENTEYVQTNVSVCSMINFNTYGFCFSIINPRVTSKDFVDFADLINVSCHGKKMKIKLKVKNIDASKFSGIILRFRSKTEDVEIPFDFKSRQVGRHAFITATCDFSKQYPLREVFWDFLALYTQDGFTHRIKVKSRRISTYLKLYFTNLQCDTYGDKNIIFPYIAKNSFFACTYREKSEYDTTLVRIKEVIALLLFIVLFPVLKLRKIWIVYEKFCKTAQDNGYYFFKFCMEQLEPKQKRNIYYVIDKKEADYAKLKQYGKHVIQFMSVKHMLYCLAMNICISSDSTAHLYTWRSKPSFIRHKIKRSKELFLQHGVTALKRVDKLFGKKGSSPMTYFVTCSQREQFIVEENFNYTSARAPITGFARWDVLEDKSTDDDKFILLMPTWRSWLEEVSNEMFVESDYYKNYYSVITDERLNAELERNNIRLVLYLHPKFASYVDEFKSKLSKNISCMSFGEVPLNDIMMKCSMLITDYSSVCWDVLYQNKAVLYYQFDYEQYDLVHGSYIDFKTELPGERFTEKEELINGICDYINSGLKIKDEHAKMADEFFAYRDNKNSRRIYNFLKTNGH